MSEDKSFLKKVENMKSGFPTAAESLNQIFSMVVANQFEDTQQEALYRLWVLPARTLITSTTPKNVTFAWANLWKQELITTFTETAEDLVVVNVTCKDCSRGEEFNAISTPYDVDKSIIQKGIWEDDLLRSMFLKHFWGQKK